MGRRCESRGNDDLDLSKTLIESSGAKDLVPVLGGGGLWSTGFSAVRKNRYPAPR